jgi:hypothetical protein
MWCNARRRLETLMAVTAKQPAPAREGTRASVTFPAGLYAELERIAEEKKVSVAWVVRDAVEKYVEAQYPLFSRQQ